MMLGLAVRQYEEDRGIKRDALQFDNEEIVKVIQERNKILGTIDRKG